MIITWYERVLILSCLGLAPACAPVGWGADSPVRSARVRMGQAAQAQALIDQGLAPAQELLAQTRAREPEFQSLPGWPRVAELDRAIRTIEVFRNAGDLSRAWEQVQSLSFAEAQRRVSAEVMEAIPFLVLGPFGSPSDTDTAAPGKPLVKGYQGLDYPYLAEIAETNYHSLVKDFAPNLTNAYPVYPNRMGRWQKAAKTYYLDFAQAGCAAPAPYWMVAYAYTEIFSPVKRECAFYIGLSHDGYRAWVNGGLMGGRYGTVGVEREPRPDQGFTPIALQQGWNRVLFKMVQRPGSRFYVRVVTFQDPATKRVTFPVRDLKFRVPALGKNP